MLLFIMYSNTHRMPELDSNTSHVIIYRFSAFLIQRLCLIQIHLMLLFIKTDRRKTRQWFTIQIHLMLLFILSSVL